VDVQRSTVARLVLVVTALPPCATAGNAASTEAAARTPAHLRHFQGGGVAFRYPATWRRYAWRFDGSFSHSIVTLSTGAERNPCVTTATSIMCTSPLRRLEALADLVSNLVPAPTEPPRLG
jgi:hypothetical protein